MQNCSPCFDVEVVVDLAEEALYLLAKGHPQSEVICFSVWSTLPQEIWTQIFLQLHPAYLHNSLSVCKSWGKILNSTQFLLRKQNDVEEFYKMVLLGPPCADWLNPPEKWAVIISKDKIEAFCPIACATGDPNLTQLFWDFMKQNWYGKPQHGSDLKPPPLEVAIFYRGVYKRVCFVFIPPISETGGCHARLFLCGKSINPNTNDYSKFAMSRFHNGLFVSLQLLSIFSRSRKTSPPFLLHFLDQESHKPMIQPDTLCFNDSPLPSRLRVIEGRLIESSMKRFLLRWHNTETGVLECPTSHELLFSIWRRQINCWQQSKDQHYEKIHLARSNKLQLDAFGSVVALFSSFCFACLLTLPHAFINLLLFLFSIFKQFWCLGFVLAAIGVCFWPFYTLYSFYLVFKRSYDYGFPEFLYFWWDRVIEDFKAGGCDWGCQEWLNFHAD